MKKCFLICILAIQILIGVDFSSQAQVSIPEWTIPNLSCDGDENCLYIMRLDELQDLYLYDISTQVLAVSPNDGSPATYHDLSGVPLLSDFVPFSDNFIIFSSPIFDLYKYDLQTGLLNPLALPFQPTSCEIDSVSNYPQSIFRLDNDLLVCSKSGDDITLNLVGSLTSTP